MIICKYRDGSSIRVYDSDQKRLKAIKALLNMGYAVKRLASCPNHYSLKAMSRNGILFAEYREQLLKHFWEEYERGQS
jgi:hypothetical protein